MKLGVDIDQMYLYLLTKSHFPAIARLGVPCPLPAGVTCVMPFHAMPKRLGAE